jgi:uncharacterized paraquat-inducible protein A
LFSAKASFMGMTVVDMEKSTLGAIHLLMEKGRWGAAITILICSVVAPFLKLAVLLVCTYYSQRQNAGSRVASAITLVRRISKWATVDAFTASIFVSFFCSNPVVQVGLHRGFYCFMGYCIFSTAGALLLERPEVIQQAAIADQRRQYSSAKSSWPAVLSSILLLGFLVTLSLLPIFHVEMMFIKEQLSFVDIVHRLAVHGSFSAAFAVLSLAAVLPMADLVWASLEATLPLSSYPVGEWLQDFAMFDVFALATLVTANAAGGVHSGLTVALLPGGWCLSVCASIWIAYSATLRSRPVADQQDKLTASFVVDDIDFEKTL